MSHPHESHPLCVALVNLLHGNKPHRSCARCRRRNVTGQNALCFNCKLGEQLRSQSSPQTHRFAAAQSGPPPPGVLRDLGVDADTYRQLSTLQARDISPSDYDLLLRLSTTANIKTLPEDALAKVKANAFVATADTNGQCAVCLCQMSTGEKLCRLPCEGKHVFHHHCIVEWLSTSSRCCPIDQQDLTTCCLTA